MFFLTFLCLRVIFFIVKNCRQSLTKGKNTLWGRQSSLLLLFYYLAPLINDCLVMSRWIQFTFGDKREVCLPVGRECTLLVTRKESMRKRKKSIGPRMKYGHSNLEKTTVLSYFLKPLSNRSCFWNKWPTRKYFLKLWTEG